MFGRLNLMRDGAQVDGVVVESTFKPSRITGPGEHALPARIWRLKLQVQFEDGTTTEVERKVDDDDYGGTLVHRNGRTFPSEGDPVPMRYDPKDRSKIEIDVAAIKANRRQKYEEEGARVDRLTDLLRGDLRFRGVAITDDLADPAITSSIPVPDAAVQAVKAGADMVWISGPASDQQAAYVALLRAVQRRQVSRRRLDEALYRVLIAKRQYGLIR